MALQDKVYINGKFEDLDSKTLNMFDDKAFFKLKDMSGSLTDRIATAPFLTSSKINFTNSTGGTLHHLESVDTGLLLANDYGNVAIEIGNDGNLYKNTGENNPKIKIATENNLGIVIHKKIITRTITLNPNEYFESDKNAYHVHIINSGILGDNDRLIRVTLTGKQHVGNKEALEDDTIGMLNANFCKVVIVNSPYTPLTTDESAIDGISTYAFTQYLYTIDTEEGNMKTDFGLWHTLARRSVRVQYGADGVSKTFTEKPWLQVFNQNRYDMAITGLQDRCKNLESGVHNHVININNHFQAIESRLNTMQAQINELISKSHKITFQTTTPSNSQGNDGDIVFVYQ